MDEPTLDTLVGRWEGSGEGGFPTLAPFSYREVLEVRAGDAGPFLHYVQQTWRHQEGGEVGSHHETGFITPGEGATVAVFSAQGADRLEALHGEVTVERDILVLDLSSFVVASDERMVSSWRRFEIEGDELRYTMGMATTQVPDGAVHITARLHRR